MAEAATALGIASFGIQVCQSLLAYYDSWKDYQQDIRASYESITDLYKTLLLLREFLSRSGLDLASVAPVETGLNSCVGGLEQLRKELYKLQTHHSPSGLRQKAWAQVQRSFYPFQASALARLREIVGDLQQRLALALQVLQLEISATSIDTLNRIEITSQGTAAQVQNLLTAQQAVQFHKIIDWLSPPDPQTNHAFSRRLHEPQTGNWFLKSDRYKRWRGGYTRHLWVYGKAGCGKTILSSTIIEDLQLYCENVAASSLAMFYFSFSDNGKQSFDGLLRSLLAQLGRCEPCQSMLQREFDKSNRSLPGLETLEKIFLSCITQRAEVFLVLDALDECPETNDSRRDLLASLIQISKNAPSLKIFATSCERRDIKDSMEMLGADVVSFSIRAVDADIAKYVASELSRDQRLSRLDWPTKALIQKTIAQSADGMFRWAYCQLQELKKLKSTRPSHIREALHDLPRSLERTYGRMLARIEENLHYEALILLNWLAYARSPLSLVELAEVLVINLQDEIVDTADRGSPEDTLDILSGLVIVDEIADCIYDTRTDQASGTSNNGSNNAADVTDPQTESQELLSADDTTNIQLYQRQIKKDTQVRLAHFSVKEYLESDRLAKSEFRRFSLHEGEGHRLLAQSCITYIMHYSSSPRKTSTREDLVAFPIIGYAARAWYYHSSLQQTGNFSRERQLLCSKTAKRDWLLVHMPEIPWTSSFHNLGDVGSALYYASLTGLTTVVDDLLSSGTDITALGGFYGTALEAASSSGHEEVVRKLIDAGADISTMGGHYGSALIAASEKGHEKVIKTLISVGADVSASGRFHGNALQAASQGGHEKVVQMLIDAGADVTDEDKFFTNALQRASVAGHEKVVKMLIDAGADVNFKGGLFYSNALQAALEGGREKVVTLLINAGANVNA